MAKCLCHWIDPCPGTVGSFSAVSLPKPEPDWNGNCQCKTPKVVNYSGNGQDLDPAVYCGLCLGDLETKQ
jgi:hypothetical protein